jgi:tyrosinase
MQANLSPVDPLFFLHHANIDRIWDVWTRKQLARGYPILPQGYPAQPGAPVPPGSDFAAWAGEPFLFFVDAKGQPATKTSAGDYATIGDFNYEYQPGSGEQVVPAPAMAAAAPAQRVQRFNAQITAPGTGATRSAGGSVTLPPGLLQGGTGPGAPRLVAQVTVALPPVSHAREFAVVVNPPAGAPGVGPSSPHFVASLAMFGHQIMRGPVTFAIPLSDTVATLRAKKLLAPNAPLNIRVVPQPAAMAPAATRAHAGEARAEVLSIVVEAQ